MSQDIARCPLGDKTTPTGETLLKALLFSLSEFNTVRISVKDPACYSVLWAYILGIREVL